MAEKAGKNRIPVKGDQHRPTGYPLQRILEGPGYGTGVPGRYRDLAAAPKCVFCPVCGDCFDNPTLDTLAESYINDDVMRNWLITHNRFAAEEMARRLLEVNSRGKRNGKPHVLKNLRNNYLSIKGNLEGGIESSGAIQGGTVEIINDEHIPH